MKVSLRYPLDFCDFVVCWRVNPEIGICNWKGLKITVLDYLSPVAAELKQSVDPPQLHSQQSYIPERIPYHPVMANLAPGTPKPSRITTPLADATARIPSSWKISALVSCLIRLADETFLLMQGWNSNFSAFQNGLPKLRSAERWISGFLDNDPPSNTGMIRIRLISCFIPWTQN